MHRERKGERAQTRCDETRSEGGSVAVHETCTSAAEKDDSGEDAVRQDKKEAEKTKCGGGGGLAEKAAARAGKQRQGRGRRERKEKATTAETQASAEDYERTDGNNEGTTGAAEHRQRARECWRVCLRKELCQARGLSGKGQAQTWDSGADQTR